MAFFSDNTMMGYLAFAFSRCFATMDANTTNKSSIMSSPKWSTISGSITALMQLATFAPLPA